MFGKIRKGLRGDGYDEKQEENVEAPYVFDSDTYNYPSLYEEADEMLQVALLIYTMTDLRALAKKKKTTLVNPELVLTLPLRYVREILYLFFTPSTCTNLSYSAKAWNLSEND